MNYYISETARKMAQSIVSRGAGDPPVAIYWSPKICRLRIASGSRRSKLDLLCDQNLLVLVGVYGRPWPDGFSVGRTKILTEWILDDLGEILPAG